MVSIRQGERVKREPSRSSHLHFECDAEGLPRPLIAWLWDGQIITENDTYWSITDITHDPIHQIHKARYRNFLIYFISGFAIFQPKKKRKKRSLRHFFRESECDSAFHKHEIFI